MSIIDDMTIMDDIEVSTYKPYEFLRPITICKACVGGGVDLDVRVGTTGYHGGDNGCDTYLSLRNLNGQFIFTGLKDKTEQNDGFTISARGDLELDALIGSLRFALQMLEIQRKTLSARDDSECERKAALQGD